jgi:Fe-S-cluster containining protein
MLIHTYDLALFAMTLLVLGLLLFSARRGMVLYKGLKRARRRDGFRCMECGRCCRHYKINVTEKDIQRLERHGHDRRDFLGEPGFLRKVGGSCVFLEGNRCTVHSHKPDACRSWPFNRRILGKVLVARRFDCPALEALSE